jgi:hypothetical protein
MPASSAQDFGLQGLLTLEPVAFSAKVVDIRKHPRQQSFGRQGVYPGPLKPKDILPLARDLGAHPLDFGSELVKLHRGLPWLGLFQSAGAQPSSAGRFARVTATGFDGLIGCDIQPVRVAFWIRLGALGHWNLPLNSSELCSLFVRASIAGSQFEKWL